MSEIQLGDVVRPIKAIIDRESLYSNVRNHEAVVVGIEKHKSGKIAKLVWDANERLANFWGRPPQKMFVEHLVPTGKRLTGFNPMSDIKKGDKVAYSRDFLRNTGQFTGPIPFARGVVTEIETLGKGGRTKIAVVEWSRDFGRQIPERINVANLVRADQIQFESRNNPGNSNLTWIVARNWRLILDDDGRVVVSSPKRKPFYPARQADGSIVCGVGNIPRFLKGEIYRYFDYLRSRGKRSTSDHYAIKPNPRRKKYTRKRKNPKRTKYIRRKKRNPKRRSKR